MWQCQDAIYPDDPEYCQILASGPNFNLVRNAEKNQSHAIHCSYLDYIVTYQFRVVLRMNRSNVIMFQQKETS